MVRTKREGLTGIPCPPNFQHAKNLKVRRDRRGWFSDTKPTDQLQNMLIASKEGIARLFMTRFGNRMVN